ncbi:hypothetical protein FQA39_LY16116 [Lamprigera yunnana]|nr:hypothetical protein FQA39_LY16116 [Lamprigera yunnana]
MSSTLRGKHLHAQAREMAFNVYQWIKSQNENQCTKEIKEKVLRATGVSVRTIESIIKEGSASFEFETDKRFKRTARYVFIISNFQTWSQVKTALINRFGDCRNENFLENDLITCFQLTSESYQDYYERIRTKLQCLLEQININEDNEPLKNYKIQIFNKKALATYLSGLVEPYYLLIFMNYHTVNSLEECLLKLKDYDNHRQQANFMNFMRQKDQNKHNYKPINNYQKPQQFKPHQNKSPNFNPQNASRQFNYNPQIPSHNHYTDNSVHSQERSKRTPIVSTGKRQRCYHRCWDKYFDKLGPINIQNRPITTKYPTNDEIFGKKIESRPTPMSISTRNTNANYRPNFPRQQNVFQSNGPRNFKSEELFNFNEGHNDSEPIRDDFEDRLVDYNKDLIEADENDKSNYSESPVNFRMPASEELTST